MKDEKLQMVSQKYKGLQTIICQQMNNLEEMDKSKKCIVSQD